MTSSGEFLMIVRRHEISRYAALQSAFVGEPVSVIWDRRRGERRRETAPVGADRRQTDRRRPPPDTWRYLDFVVAPAGQGPTAPPA